MARRTTPKRVRIKPLKTSPEKVLRRVFEAAKKRDEFEFCCCLLQPHGITTWQMQPLVETATLTNQLIHLIHSPILPDLRLRLSLFLYCHLTEMTELCAIPANLLRVTRGERYHLQPLATAPAVTMPRDHYTRLSPEVEALSSLARWAGFPSIANLYELFFVRQVRNAFYHSDYVLTESSFNICRGQAVAFSSGRGSIGRTLEKVLDYSWLQPRIDLGVNTAFALLHLVEEYKHSYQQNKVVTGRLAADGSYIAVELTATHAGGLYGFQCPPSQ